MSTPDGDGPGPPQQHEPRSRAPIALAVIAGILLIAVIVTLALAIGRGSDAAPAPTQTSGATTATASTATPAPTPTADEVGEPVALNFSATGFTLVDASATALFTYAWADDAADAVTALTDAFGAAPTERIEPGDRTHYPDYRVYQWDGFMLFDMVERADGALRAEYAQPSYVMFSRNEIRNITLVAERGLRIGMPVTAVRAAGPDAETPRGNVGTIRFIFDQERSEAPGDGALQYSVIADTDGSVVTAILYFRSLAI